MVERFEGERFDPAQSLSSADMKLPPPHTAPNRFLKFSTASTVQGITKLLTLVGFRLSCKENN